ncbi:ABC transporter permease [Ohtaekwangia sp.]|uniref:ABC transporter permease n=1 Tax=Ohtaekwangia sp. TaxID=2066019 RepID=UPI002FDE1B90
MNLPFFIARRYLLSKRKKNFINIISILSIISVAFSTAALIIVLSVFNGLEDLLRSLNDSFDPEIKIEAATGKSFQTSDKLVKKVKAVKGVKLVTEVIEDYAYVHYRDANQIVTLKGVSDNFIEQNRIPQENITQGKLQLKKGKINYALVGQGISNTLTLAVDDPMFAMQIYYIRDVKGGTTDPSKMYSRMNIVPGGVFSIIQYIDENYVLVPLDFARELFNYGNKRTSFEIKIADHFSINEVKEELRKVLGDKFNVLNQEEQHKDLYRLLKIEKLFTFLSLTLLLAIGSINIFFSLMMLAIDKKKDISILASMGADQKLIRNIFLAEGALIAFIGTLIGLAIGGIFCWIQLNFGIISMGMESAIMQGYPIKVSWVDFAATLGVVTVITFLISSRPAVQAARFVSPEQL